MQNLHRLTVAEQTADFLRKGIRRGRWNGRLPGAVRLAAELGVSKASLIGALDLLEAEGLVISRGVGKYREVAEQKNVPQAGPKRRLRVGILPYENQQHSNAFKQRQILGIAAGVESAGHTPFVAPRSQIALKGDADRIMKMVEQETADVWILLNPVPEIQDRFLAAEIPAFSVGGRIDSGLPSCAYSMAAAIRAATDRLVFLGHRRITLVCPQNWRRPEPNEYLADFLVRLKNAGIGTGEYNAPEWKETPEGFRDLLKSLFAITPPTALIVADSRQAMAVMTFLSAHHLAVGKDVSLIVRIPDPVFEWAHPAISHFEFDESQVVKTVTRWLTSFAKGRVKKETDRFPCVFVDGETVGAPVAKRS